MLIHITVILYNYFLVEVLYYRLFLIKTSSRNAIRKKLWQVLGLLILLVRKEDCKMFCTMSRIRPVTGGAGTPVLNIQATLRIAPEFFKNVSLALLFGGNGNSYTVSHSAMCVCVYIFFTALGCWSDKSKTNGTVVPKESSHVTFWASVPLERQPWCRL